MKSCFLIGLAILWLSGSPVSGQSVTFDPDIRKFYFYLDTASGNRLLNERYLFHDPAYIRIIGYREFLHTLLYQSKSNLDFFLNRSDAWLKQLGKSGDGNILVPAATAELHLYRALLNSHFSLYKASAAELLASYKIVAKSGTGFNSSDRNKLSGIIGVLLNQVPDQYLKYLKVIGVRPSGLSGYNGLERYYSGALPGSFEHMEGYLLLITAYKEFGKDPADAWNFVKAAGMLMLDNPLIRYQSALAALKAGECESAIKLLDPKVKGNPVPAFPYWNYQLGRFKLFINDPACPVYLERFLSNPGGDNYRHNAGLLAGWYYLVNGRPDLAHKYHARLRTLPEPFTPYDRQALREVVRGGKEEVDVLKVRLLFDGGYFERCLNSVDTLITSGKYSEKDTGELFYRKARCEQRLGRTTAAINSYLGVIERAEAIKSYIVPNAALQLGALYKKEGQVDLARKYYQVSLDQNKYGYREGISRQAETALKELER